VIAEAELAWELARVVVLAGAQADLKGVWISGGWVVLSTENEEWPSMAVERIRGKE